MASPWASIDVPVADLNWAPGGRGSNGGAPMSSYCFMLIQLLEASVSIKAKHGTLFILTGM